ncbi:MAG TPA: hypothetical protein DER09_00190 [Prolixibacteraceae bacterium]|nr:hypothetical protein [Prolixibacteraceae bacterium]
MKTITFRLLATMITLAAVTTSTNTLNAQRRSTGNSEKTEQAGKVKSERRETVREKSGSRDNAYERKAAGRTVKNINEVKRNSSVQRNEQERSRGTISGRTEQTQKTQRNPENRNSYERSDRDNRTSVKSGNDRDRDYNRTNNEWRNAESRNDERRTSGSVERVTRGNYEADRNGRSDRISGVSNRERYHLNDNDNRYKPNDNYKGGKNYWSSEIRNHNKQGKKYNSGHYNHWDNHWEYYRWNHNSWRNYYSYYDPYSYRHHKYYFQHPYYGHVIRRFVYEPAIFIHNHNRYYCYDGHFFRHRPGVGYILVDIPYGMQFEFIPDDYEMVNINGYLYYRVGNLFFEYTRSGYELVHYPERYYAYDDNYYNGGFRFEITVN